MATATATSSGTGSGSGTDSSSRKLQWIPTVPPDNASSFVVVGVVQRMLLLSVPSILVPGAVGASGGAGNNPSGEAEEAAVRSGASGGAVHGHLSQSPLHRFPPSHHLAPLHHHQPQQGQDQVQPL